jgi:hypothetical protein
MTRATRFAIAAAAVVITAAAVISSSRAIAPRAGESASPEDDGWSRVDISVAPTPTPPPCNGTLITILDEKFDDVTPPDLPPLDGDQWDRSRWYLVANFGFWTAEPTLRYGT